MTNNITDEERALLTPDPALRNRVSPVLRQAPVREEVSPEELADRLTRQRKRNAALMLRDKQSRIEKNLLDWRQRIGPVYANAKTDIPRVNERVERLVSGDKLHNSSMIFFGPIGAGKTWQAYAYIAQAIQQGAVTPGQIVATTESTTLSPIAVGGFRRQEMMEELLADRHRIFFFDDVGTGYFREQSQRTDIWFQIINHVYTHRHTLLLTTNLGVNQSGLGNWLGDRAFDRLMALVGRDGILEIAHVNRRPGVAEENERQAVNRRRPR